APPAQAPPRGDGGSRPVQDLVIDCMSGVRPLGLAQRVNRVGDGIAARLRRPSRPRRACARRPSPSTSLPAAGRWAGVAGGGGGRVGRAAGRRGPAGLRAWAGRGLTVVAGQERGIWEDRMQGVRERIPEVECRTRFNQATPVGFVGGALVMGVPETRASDWLRSKYTDV